MSEHPLQDNVTKLDTYRPAREGTEFGNTDDEQRLDFRKYTLAVGQYDADQIARTRAAGEIKRDEPNAEAMMVRSITRGTAEVMTARIDGMHINDRPFLKEAS